MAKTRISLKVCRAFDRLQQKVQKATQTNQTYHIEFLSHSKTNSEFIKSTVFRVGTNQTFPDSIWRKLKWFYSTNIDNVTIELATFRWHPTMKRLVIADKWNYVPGWLGHFINENAGRKSCCETRQLAGSFRTLEMAFKSKHEHTSKEKDSI